MWAWIRIYLAPKGDHTSALRHTSQIRGMANTLRTLKGGVGDRKYDLSPGAEYAMLVSLEQDRTAVHGCHDPRDMERMADVCFPLSALISLLFLQLIFTMLFFSLAARDSKERTSTALVNSGVTRTKNQFPLDSL